MPVKRYYVSGRVQGVFFRASARAEAERLGVRGYARNLPDGRVEVVGEADSAALAELERWLRQGPPNAIVTGVTCDEVTESVPHRFETR